MKRLTSFAALLLLGQLLLAQPPAEQRHLRLTLPRDCDTRAVAALVSIDRRSGDTLYLHATPQQEQQLAAMGLRPEAIAATTSSAVRGNEMATTVDELTADWARYPTYSTYRQLLQQLASAYPSLCRLDSIGQSVQGRQLYMLRITQMDDTSMHKPKFLYSSTMHGDETTGFVLMLRLAHHLLAEYGRNDSISELLNTVQVFICPNTNPDGTYASGDNNVSIPTRSNANRIDLNRNFTHPMSERPFGEPLQPEALAMMRLAELHQFAMGANLHGGAEVICYPWDYWYTSERIHPDDAWFRAVCRAYADTVHAYAPASHFVDRDNGITHGGDWYPITGSRADYMNYYHSCREFTIEVSATKCPNASTLPLYWQWHRRALIDMVFAIRTGLHGTVSNRHGQPLRARIGIVGLDADGSAVSSDATTGVFHRPIAPGAYSMCVEADGYRPHVQSIEVEPYAHIDVVLDRPQVAFSVVDATLAPIAHARIALGPDTLIAALDGTAIFYDVPYGVKLAYSVSAEGYVPLADSIVVLDDTTLQIQLRVLPQVAFSVVDTTHAPIAHARIALGPDTLIAALDGTAIFYDVPYGAKLAYSVSAEGYVPLADSIVVLDDTTLRIQLRVPLQPPQPNPQPSAQPVGTAPLAQLWPNPFGDELRIVLPSANVQRIDIYSAQGQLVHTCVSQQGTATWRPAPHLPRGTYWLRVVYRTRCSVQIVVYQ